MKNRKWTNKQKLEIVLEGLNGRVTISDLCNRHQIQQTQYYEWKNHFLRHGEKVFELGKASSTEDRLEKENRRLKTLIGDLTMELKKTTTQIKERFHVRQRTKQTIARAHRRAQVRAPLLGLPPHLGLPQVPGRPPNQQKTHLSHHARTEAPGHQEHAP